ncbi:MAG TPA: hypothetical protein VHG51_10220 [Longimicrobiaceae bacterium]|nr:hypothetical protein [Longimicrobiaceae bacterium]
MGFTRLLMTASAVALGLLGLAGSFVPDEVLGWMGAPASPPLVLLVQLLGALYLGFAVLDWMARGNLIGGIYSRPVATGNLLHFLSAGIAILRLLARAPELRALWPLALVYTLLAAGFAVVLFRHPVRPSPAAKEAGRPA